MLNRDKNSCSLSNPKHKDYPKIEYLQICNKGNANAELLSQIKEFLFESSTIYPSIGSWWDKRVVPGLKNKERVCHTIIINGEIAALSIIKLARSSSKLCTFRVQNKYRGIGIGQFLLDKTLSKLSRSKQIHYTISEEVQNQYGDFFSSCGFSLLAWKKNYYVKGMDELVFSNSPNIFAKKMRTDTKKLILFSIKPEYAGLIEQGEKFVEFRRRFSPHINSAKALFYVSHPVREIRFMADIYNIVRLEPTKLWEQFSNSAGVNFEGFNDYFKGTAKGSALILNNVRPLPRPLSLDHLRLKLQSFQPPQSYRVVEANDALCSLIPSFNVER